MICCPGNGHGCRKSVDETGDFTELASRRGPAGFDPNYETNILAGDEETAAETAMLISCTAFASMFVITLCYAALCKIRNRRVYDDEETATEGTADQEQVHRMSRKLTFRNKNVSTSLNLLQKSDDVGIIVAEVINPQN